jgi:hypothetical protein
VFIFSSSTHPILLAAGGFEPVEPPEVKGQFTFDFKTPGELAI